MRLWLSIALLLVGGGVQQQAPGETLRPATTADLLTAASYAASHPGTTIILSAGGQYALSDTLMVRGSGTTLDLNGATIAYNAHNDGVHGQSAIDVMPVLSDAPPWTHAATWDAWAGQTGDFVWLNVPGTTGALETKLGGDIQPGILVEPAPVQYPGPTRPPIGSVPVTYGKVLKVLVPAQDITVKNGTITVLDHGAYMGLGIIFARNCKVENIAITGEWLYGAGQLSVQESEHIDIGHVTGATVIVNSSTWVSLQDSQLGGGIEGEEATRFLTVTNVNCKAVRSNDRLCDHWTVENCTLTESDPNYGPIMFREHGDGMVVKGCTFTNLPGFTGDGGSVLLQNNKGPGFYRYVHNKSDVTEIGNSWNVVPSTRRTFFISRRWLIFAMVGVSVGIVWWLYVIKRRKARSGFPVVTHAEQRGKNGEGKP